MSTISFPVSRTEPVRPGLRAELVPARRLRAAATLGPSTTAGFRPAHLPLGPMPGSEACEALLAPNGALESLAAADFNPGTPADPSLFKTWPWSAVGKVHVGRLVPGGGVEWDSEGSGCMVGRGLMLTASHVAPWDYVNSTTWVMRFSPAYVNAPAFGIGSADVAAWHGTVDDTSEEGEIFGRDYVVCDLYEPIGDKVGWLPVTSLKESRYDDFIYTSIGYPGDVQQGKVPCVEPGLTIRDIDNGGTGGKQLETRRYGGGGWSGGPLWANIDGEVKIAAVHSGEETDGLDPRRTVHSGGGRLVDFVSYGLTHWEGNPWTSLGGACASGPGAVLQHDGKLVVAVRGPEDAIWLRYQLAANGDWSEWESLGGLVTSEPDLCLNPQGGVVVFARGSDNALWVRWQNEQGSEWNPWTSLGGACASGPGAVLQHDGKLVVAVRGPEDAIWLRYQLAANGDWSEWESLGGLVTSEPDLCLNPQGGVVVFARGSDNALWVRWQNEQGSEWNPWTSLGGACASGPGAVLQHDGKLVVAVRGPEDAIWLRYQLAANGDWSEWESLGGLVTSEPDLCLNPQGGVVVFARGSDNALWVRWQNAEGAAWD